MKDGQVLIFGEVLFDCFPGGERVLGGAPFNVAWHLQALGDRPRLISRVGDDDLGREILNAMSGWGMDVAGVQVDKEHPTGQVRVEMPDGEPRYTITPDCAYDFIDAGEVKSPSGKDILYHGSLCLRNRVSREAFSALAKKETDIFLDVNLRPPWWRKDEVHAMLERARWVKLNEDELSELGFSVGDLERRMQDFLTRFRLDQLIVTRGGEGALVLTAGGELQGVTPEPIADVVDTVGAGDAFTAVYIHGLRCARPVAQILHNAQRFASAVVGLRGAVSTDSEFYRPFLADRPLGNG